MRSVDHTPGPWRVEGDYTVWAADGRIADCGTRDLAVAHANTAAIAAVPDLIAAARLALNALSPDGTTHTSIAVSALRHALAIVDGGR